MRPVLILRLSMSKTKNKIEVVPSSGNVFADLSLPNTEERRTKAGLALSSNKIIRKQPLSQAARRLKISQRKISALRNFRLQTFSIEDLMRFLAVLGR